MNKGLEVIEAHHLFGMPYERIDVVVHPQSIVHSCVALSDGAMLAHLGYPDMRVPIAFALHGPSGAARAPTARPGLGGKSRLRGGRQRGFPSPQPGPSRGNRGRDGPCVLNAANEVAVAAFLDGRLPFTGIPELIGEALAGVETGAASSFDALVEADGAARAEAERLLAGR